MPEVQSAQLRVCALVGMLAVLLVFAWTAARIHYVFDGNWTALFCTGTNFPVPPDLEAGTYRFDGNGYDGQFYRYLAHDPFLQKDYSRFVDSPQLRFRRLLVPLAAWLLALGQPGWIDVAYIGVEMLFLGLGGYWCARLLIRRGRSPFWGFLFVVVPGTLASFDRMLVDGPLTALFAGLLLYCDEDRWLGAWIIAVLAALTRDTGLLLCAALVTDRLLNRDWRRAACFASSVLPAAAWYAYVASRLPQDAPVALLTVPLWGLVRRLFWFRLYPEPRLQLLLRVTDFLAVLGLAVSIILAVRWILEQRVGPPTLCAGFFAVLALVLGSPDHMINALGFARPVSPLLLWIMIEAVSRRTWKALAPPLLVSLSVSLVVGIPLVTIVNRVLGR